MLYVIRNQKTSELWTNSEGWGEDVADIFTDKERRVLDLPLDGEWMTI